jgi:NAD(P)-dependent dehydrogenase (short-subunit alcohol dehydrogenase family)
MAPPDERPLAGRVVVVDPTATDVALAMARYGATVVIAGVDAEASGELATQIEAAGGRAAVFTGDLTRDPDRAALAELLAELFE